MNKVTNCCCKCLMTGWKNNSLIEQAKEFLLNSHNIVIYCHTFVNMFARCSFYFPLCLAFVIAICIIR